MKGWVVFLMVVAVVMGVYLEFLAPNIYSGKEVFTSESEYMAFKEAVANPHISVEKVAILASEPPIIVDFRFVVDRGEVFPYGNKGKDTNLDGYILMGVGVGGLLFALLYKPKKPSKEGK